MTGKQLVGFAISICLLTASIPAQAGVTDNLNKTLSDLITEVKSLLTDSDYGLEKIAADSKEAKENSKAAKDGIESSEYELKAITNKLGTLETSIEAVQSSSGVVKSVQRGYFSASLAGNDTININPVDPEKSIVILNNVASNASNHSAGVALVSFSSSSLTLYHGSIGGYYSWQVIEFYYVRVCYNIV